MLDAALAEAEENGEIEEGDVIDDRVREGDVATDTLDISDGGPNDKDKNMAKAVADSEKGDDIYGDSSDDKKAKDDETEAGHVVKNIAKALTKFFKQFLFFF